MMYDRMDQMPKTGLCRKCMEEKPIKEMIVVRHKKQKKFSLRCRCKKCHNEKERGYRREYKTKYLRRWRKNNPELTESYWKDHQAENRPIMAERARKRIEKYHYAILIQGRMKRRLGTSITVHEAQELLRTFGPCYPTRFGLTPSGLRECERIRSAQRRLPAGKRDKPVEIRMMVYADSKHHFIKPRLQKPPYQTAAQRLSQWQSDRKKAA